MKKTLFQITTADTSNAYLYAVGKDGIVIDAGDGCEGLKKIADEKGILIHGIALTHCHYDHINGLDRLLSVLNGNVPVYLHYSEVTHPRNSYLCLAHIFGKKFSTNIPFTPIANGDTLTFGDGRLQVLHTPGHSLGSSCFYDGEILFSGDTLFYGTIGRTDHFFGDTVQLIHMVQERILPLPKETIVYPGHAQKTTIGQECIHNPFLRGE